MSQKFLNPVEVDGQVSAEYLDLSTSTSHSVNVGEIAWNSVDGTFDIGLLNGVTLQAGQEMYFYGKATEAISNGNAVMFAGVQGDHILIAKATPAAINANPEYFMGVATQDFTTNQFGYVTAFGNVRGLNTTGYTLNTVLYFDSNPLSSPGLLTEVKPTAPNAKVEVAAVVRVHETQGILMVRPHTMPKLSDVQDVKITGISANNILYWTTSNRWENGSVSTVLGYTPANSSHTHTFDSLTSKTGGTGTYQTSGDFRAPIFYDSNNTGYYLNPDGLSNLYNVTANTFVKSGGTSSQFLKADGSVDSNTYLTSVTNITGYSGTLISEDNRTISPSELAANRLKFGFTSWDNNNTSPYADFIHLRSYQDASGGSDNLVMFKKSGIGMRIWQQTYGSTTAYSTYKDIAFTDGTNATGTWSINITGNAGTATTLETPRTINGTSFNGSSDIETSYWGATRTITIGATGKTVNGSGNQSWSLAEIGAYAATNPNGYTSNTGTVTSVSGTGGYGGLTLSGTVVNSGSLTLGGTPSGTWPISITGNSTSVSGLTLTSSANGINPNNVTQNQLGYNTNVNLFGQIDGGLYSSAYSSVWIHQIYGDFRTGQIAIRGKNNGTWQAWRTVLDSSNFGSYAASTSHTHTFDSLTNKTLGTGTYQTSGDFRAPIFYDSNNTGYYLDPASTTNLNIVRAASKLSGAWIGVENTSSSSGNGLSLYNGDNYGGGAPIYGIMFAGTGTFGTHGSVTSDWATYLTMSDTTTRGWIFRRGSTNVASISGTGTITTDGYIYANSYIQSANAMYSPIYYDGNNSAYYFDGNSTGDSIRCAGDIVAYYSDERLKDKKGNIENALEKVLSLNGFYYTPNDKAQELGYKYKEEVGVSAQEVEEVLPQIIKDAPIGQGYKTLDYGKLTPLLIEAIKEQQKQIEELKELVNKLITK